MTKKQQTMLNNYRRAECTSIHQCYRNPSSYKVEIAEMCLRLCAGMEGEHPRFFNANCYVFSFAFTYDCKQDGKKHLFYRTKAHDYDFAIE